ncbi:MAG: DUF3488 domain-containing protein [Deltaproteobacteria bacterium]|nr:DUF3488 domain-containing protein [Deltaproteobacteria bacterium]
MTLCAIGALVLSPDISLLTSIGALLLVIASWFVDPYAPLLLRIKHAWTVAAVLLSLLLVFDVANGGSVIQAAVHFLLYIVINKLFYRRTARDYLQLYVVALLMIIAATTLNPDIAFGICLVLYTLLATWAMTMLHLRACLEEQQDTPRDGVPEGRLQQLLQSRGVLGRRFFWRSSALSAAIIGAAIAFFIFFPRIGFGLFGGHSRLGLAMVGFSDEVQLGHHGTIRDNPRVVMRVITERDKLPRKPLWRGSAYDRYADGRWSQSAELRRWTVALRQKDRLFIANHAPGLPLRASPNYIRRNLLKQDIYLEPIESTILFAADRPVALELPRQLRVQRQRLKIRGAPLAELRSATRRSAGSRYLAYSSVTQPNPQTLRQAVALKRRRLQRFVQLPADLPRRVHALAERLTKDRPTLYDKVVAVQRYLQQRYRYTTTLKHREGREPIDEFLFETRAGHCEYFASAMALLLRSQGIHTRVVNGFAGGKWNDYGQFLAIRQGDAHAWIEVLFSNVGWVAFDPTPTASTALQQATTISFAERVSQLIDAIRLRWFHYVVEYDLGKQVAIGRSFLKAFRSKRTATGSQSPDRGSWRWPSIAALAIGLVALVGLLVWRRRRSAMVVPKTLAGRLYQRALSRLARAGFSKPASLTAREFARSIGTARSELAALVDNLATAYYLARYAKVEDHVPLQRAVEAIEGALSGNARAVTAKAKG